MAHQGVARSLRQQALRCRLLHGGAGGAQRREMCCTPGGARELTIYDSVSRATRALPRPAPASHGVPLITWYSCGPTVYDDAHLGHARTYVALDVARRVTEYLTHAPVHYVMGITDVDDKIIARAKERGCAPEALARDMEHRFWEDMHALNVMPPTQFTRVSEHIQDVVAYIQGIERNGFAYATPDGVYFDVHAFGSRYGKLMPSARHGTLAEDGVAAGSGERGTPVGAAHKRSARDFALWKAAKAGEPAWPSPWGAGRPGWHIECSAMTHAAVGDHLHVHAGGIDLAFPHHCNEIAQCEAHRGAETAPPWVDIFMHTGHLYIAGCKMSKSLKNFVTVRQLLHTWRDAPHIADAFRLFCMSHHYRSNLNYHDDRIREALVLLSKWHAALNDATSFLVRDDLAQTNGGVATLGTLCAPSSRRWTRADTELYALWNACALECRTAWATDFDTPAMVRSMARLLDALQKYVQAPAAGRGDAAPPQATLVWTIARGSLMLLDVCGLSSFAQLRMTLEHALLLQHNAASAASKHSTAVDAPAARTADAARPAVLALAQFRHSVRSAVAPLSKALRSNDAAQVLPVAQATVGALMGACDDVRDTSVPALGWRIQDGADGPRIHELPQEPSSRSP